MARLSKGPRTTLTTKVPDEQVPVLDSIQAVTGEDRTAILARLVSEYLESEEARELLARREEGTLPISA